jgi:hypothetical protein
MLSSLWSVLASLSTRAHEHDSELVVVNTLSESMRWVQHSLDTVMQKRLASARNLADNITRRILTSTAFSGVGSAEIADAVIEGSANERLRSATAAATQDPANTGVTGVSGVTFSAEWALDWNKQCQEELLTLPANGRPTHIFGNILDCLPAGANVSGPSVCLRATLPFVTVNPMMHCVACGVNCTATRTEWHTAGSPCNDYAGLGTHGACDGPQAKFFYTWSAHWKTPYLSCQCRISSF